jgi:putative phosphoribosyl transferase
VDGLVRVINKLFDLLTADEDVVDQTTMSYRFDIELLAKRLLAATQWSIENPALHKLPIGYFGASTGGGAALLAGAQPHNTVKAIVSRGGRPDLAGRHALPLVEAATLLIIGGNDEPVIELNQSAFDQLNCEKEMVIVPGASHLFEESGKLEEVALLSAGWFKRYLI